MTDTFVKIATVTVGSGGASSMAFSAIPSTYTDLCIKISSRSAANNSGIYVSYNSISANYSDITLYGTGSSASSTNDTASSEITYRYSSDRADAGANIFSNTEMYIPNYAGSTNKSSSVDSVTEDNISSGSTTTMGLHAGLSADTAAITSITLRQGGGNFVQYSTATLYGIKNS